MRKGIGFIGMVWSGHDGLVLGERAKDDDEVDDVC